MGGLTATGDCPRSSLAPPAVTCQPGSVLKACDLVKRFGPRLAVNGLSFSVAPREIYGLLGPNGAGKTTTISMICGLLDADEGAVEVEGRRMGTKAVAAKAAIGYVPQEVALYPNLSGRENLRFFGRLYGLHGAVLTEAIDRALTFVGLRERADDLVEGYSGGMKRRANIAAGLLHRPRLLVLDEPTVGVDPQSRNAILTSLQELAASDTAVLFASHYMDEVARLCDRVGIVDEGRLIAEGTPAELLALYGDQPYVELTTRGPADELVDAFRRLSDVEGATATERGVRVASRNTAAVLPRLIETAGRVEIDLTDIKVHEGNLEGVFLRLTGKALRD